MPDRPAGLPGREVVEACRVVVGSLDTGETATPEVLAAGKVISAWTYQEGAQWMRAIVAYEDELERLRRIEEAVKEANVKCLPSAKFEVRQMVVDRLPKEPTPYVRPRWWDQYPDGQLAALAFRVARIAGETPWEIPGEELDGGSTADEEEGTDSS